jgi:hypothetical protein
MHPHPREHLLELGFRDAPRAIEVKVIKEGDDFVHRHRRLANQFSQPILDVVHRL